MELIGYIEYQNEEVFKINGITIDLCVHLLTNETRFFFIFYFIFTYIYHILLKVIPNYRVKLL